ncbi:hypothetical protein GTZ78_32270 [Streptomyces sp. SID8361]|nr:hypothetical protein [Streptomyces sp. SID8361]
MGDETSYVNMGYWPRESMTIDEASQALADLVADAGEFGPGDRILDVEFGYGDQDFRWLDTCKPEKIVGVNVTQGVAERCDPVRSGRAPEGWADRYAPFPGWVISSMATLSVTSARCSGAMRTSSGIASSLSRDSASLLLSRIASTASWALSWSAKSACGSMTRANIDCTPCWRRWPAGCSRRAA